MSENTLTPEDLLTLGRRNLQSRLRSLAGRTRRFSPTDIERMHDALDRFAGQSRSARQAADDE